MTSGPQVADGTALLGYRTAAGRWTLFAMALGSAMVAADLTVASIALPAIGREFHAGVVQLQWVFTAYTLTLAGMLLVGGALGDRYGRRRLYLWGVGLFAAASLVCALAPGIGVLVAGRALQGAGGALLTPGSLAILEASFQPADRGRALGTWSGFTGLGAALGPSLGGWLVQAGSWRLIFLVNLPITAVAAWVAWRHVPESRDPQATGRVDLTGGVLVTVGLVGLTYGLITGLSGGWSPPSVLALAGGAALLVTFLLWESRRPNPMLPLALFASRRFGVANAVTFIVYGAVGGVMFLLPIELQQVAGYTPLQAGTALLPLTFIMLALSGRSGALAGRIGLRPQLTVGPLVTGLGLALFHRISPGGSYLTEILPAAVVFALGVACTVAPLTTAAMTAVPAEHAGVASAVNNDVGRVANLVAVAVLPPVVGIVGSAYLDPHRFSAGFGTAAFIAAGLCAAAGLLAAATMGTAGAPLASAVPMHCALEAPPLRPGPQPTLAMGADS